MILVDEYAALPALAGRPAAPLVGQPLALTYSRAYRLTRALLESGPIRLATRRQFSRLVEELSAADQQVLHALLADPTRRKKATERLIHSPDFDPRYIQRIPAEDQDASRILAQLQARGCATDVSSDLGEH